MPENKTQQELDFERKHEQDLQRLRGLRLIDDDFMAAVQAKNVLATTAACWMQTSLIRAAAMML